MILSTLEGWGGHRVNAMNHIDQGLKELNETERGRENTTTSTSSVCPFSRYTTIAFRAHAAGNENQSGKHSWHRGKSQGGISLKC
jgi:hypothetical protein